MTPAALKHRRLRSWRRIALRTAVAATLAAIGACASPPPLHYYTLVSVDTKSTAPTPAPFDIALMSVRVPAQADQSTLVLRKSAGQIELLENDLWAAPLADELRSAFSTALTRNLATSDVTYLPKNTARPLVQITIDVQRFDLTPKQTTLDAVWSARVPGATGTQIATCKSSVEQSVTSSEFAALVEAQQQAVRTIAGQISETLTRWDGKGVTGCPGG